MSVQELPFFQHIRWKPDSQELRRFAVSMLVGFTVFGLIAVWRTQGVGSLSLILWGTGVALAVSALLPGLGRVAYLAVYMPTSILGYAISNIILALIFFLVFTPIGLLLKFTGKDLLELRRARGRTGWKRAEKTDNPDRYYHQF